MADGLRTRARRGARWLLTAAIMFGLAASCAGCIWLAIPSLAYQGYKYEHDKNSQTATSHKSATGGAGAGSSTSAGGANDANTE